MDREERMMKREEDSQGHNHLMNEEKDEGDKRQREARITTYKKRNVKTEKRLEEKNEIIFCIT